MRRTTAWVQIPAWACEKVDSDLGLGGGFRRVLRFSPLFTTGKSRISHKWHKCDEKRNSKFQIQAWDAPCLMPIDHYALSAVAEQEILYNWLIWRGF